eukprot:16447052-Heterocapsa_arctica.AAC.1
MAGNPGEEATAGEPGPVPRTEAAGSRALPEGSDPITEGGCASLPPGWGAVWPPGLDRSVQRSPEHPSGPAGGSGMLDAGGNFIDGRGRRTLYALSRLMGRPDGFEKYVEETGAIA